MRTRLARVLPFRLTGAQKRVLREIADDLKSGHPMNRLLQGDVGSGKTIVALLTMLVAVENGYQLVRHVSPVVANRRNRIVGEGEDQVRHFMHVPHASHAMVRGQHADVAVGLLRFDNRSHQVPSQRQHLIVASVGGETYGGVDQFAQPDISTCSLLLGKRRQEVLVRI